MNNSLAKRRTLSLSERLLLVLLILFSALMNLGILPLLVLAVLVVFFLCYSRFALSISSYFITTIFFLLLSFSYVFLTETPSDKGYVATYIYTVLALIVCFILNSYARTERISAIHLVIRLNCYLLVIQFLFFLVTNKYLDLHYILTLFSYESRFESNSLSSFQIARNTGFFIEPSNAAAVITYLNVMYLFEVGKPNRTFVVNQLFTIFTFSFASIAISTVIIGFSLLALSGELKSKILKLTIYILTIFVVILGALTIYWRLELAQDYDAMAYRMQVLQYFKNADINSILFGKGIHIFDIPSEFNGVVLNSSHIRDSGFLINIVFSIGIIGAFFLVLGLYLFGLGFVTTSIFLMVFMFKFDYMQPVFWMAIFTYTARSNLLSLTKKKRFVINS
ncbi:hypothetical protein ACRTC9_15255 [Vibrio vulnificus]|uniref:hypothetical protein n=1 Tax=Vibrio vulnificus TaxID=672 RepID=UPI003D7CF791